MTTNPQQSPPGHAGSKFSSAQPRKRSRLRSRKMSSLVPRSQLAQLSARLLYGTSASTMYDAINFTHETSAGGLALNGRENFKAGISPERRFWHSMQAERSSASNFITGLMTR
jgi:hypothetical protein